MKIKLENYLYPLPNEKIAKYPSLERTSSKLLFYNKGKKSNHFFSELPDLLPKNSHLFLNDTKVIPARILFQKQTKAKIEIFLLEPLLPSVNHHLVMNAKKTCTWRCMIGNSKKWKKDIPLLHTSGLEARKIAEDQVIFFWKSEKSFSEILHEVGNTPLPPYLNREVDKEDEEKYQTVFSRNQGAVAAPTAGLHFTDYLLEQIKIRGIGLDYLTLHVSAGTFAPIKEKNVIDHKMHREYLWIKKSTVQNLLNATKVIAVGTTSLRVLESLYWFGFKLIKNKKNIDFFITQRDIFIDETVNKQEALEAVLYYMNNEKIELLGGYTEIFICPGYQYRLCDGLITNFHQPGSTLILLVAAFVGDFWREIYAHALKNDYRFLSYGDTSLLIK